MPYNLSVTDSRALGYVIPALLCVAFGILYVFGVELRVLLIATVAAAVGFTLLSRPSFQLVISAVVIAIVVNMAGYSFLSHNAAGERVRSAASTVVSAALLLMFLATLTVLFIRHGAALWNYFRKNWDVVLFVIVSIASTAFAFDAVRALQYVVWFSAALGIALVFWYFLARRVELDQCGVYLSALLVIGYAPFLIFALPGVINYGGKNVAVLFGGGPFYAYAAAAIYAAVLILYTADRRLFREKLLRRLPSILVGAAGLLALVSVIYSAKRSTIISVAVITIAFFAGRAIIRERRPASSVFRTVAFSVVLIGAVIVAVPQAERTITRFTRAVDSEQEDLSIEARKQILKNAIYVFKRYPIFGVGLTNGDNATETLLPRSEKSGYALHNTFLGILVEFGAVGMLLFLLMATRSAIMFFRLPSARFKFHIILLAAAPALISITEYNLTPGQALFWPLWLTVLAPRIVTMFPPPGRPSYRSGITQE